jgi:3-oxoadipate enol-lactonase
MPYAQFDPDLTIFYEEFNKSGSRAVLLLHGLGVSGESWQLQIPELTAAGYRVIVPDARGFGKSSYPRSQTTIQTMAGDFSRLISRLNHDKAHVIGISMGGTHAIQLCIDHPDQVDKLVLVNTFARLRPSNVRQRIYLSFRYFLTHIFGLRLQAVMVAKHLFPRPDQESLRQATINQILQSNPAGYRAAMRALARFNVLESLSGIKNKTMIITGAQDETIPPELQAHLKVIPGARQVIIPQAGHAVTIDQPQAFNTAVINFLDE